MKKILILLMIAINLFGQTGAVLDLDFRKGSLLNYGTANVTVTNNNVTFQNSERGQSTYFNGTNAYLGLSDVANIGTGDFSVIVWIRPSKVKLCGIINKRQSGSGWYLALSNLNIGYGLFDTDGHSIEGTGVNTVSAYQNKMIGIIINNTTKKLYVLENNILSSSVDISSLTSPITNSISLAIGRYGYYTAAGYCDGKIYRALIFQKALTQSEIDKNYQEFLSSFPIAESKRNFIYPSATSLNESGLVFAYTGDKLYNNTLVDISGSGNNGTATKVIYDRANYEYGIKFNGSNSYVTVTNNTGFNFGSNNFTIALWFYPTVQQRMGLFSGITDYWMGIDFHFSAVGTRTINLWLSSNGTNWNIINSDPGGQGIGSISLALNQWHSIVVIRNGNILQSYIDGILDINKTISGSVITKSENKRIGLWGTGGYPLAGLIRNISIYNNRAFTLQQVKDYHNSFARQTFISEDFSDYSVGSFPREWTKTSGTFAVAQLSSAEGNLKKNDKYLNCSASGVVYISG